MVLFVYDVRSFSYAGDVFGDSWIYREAIKVN